MFKLICGKDPVKVSQHLVPFHYNIQSENFTMILVAHTFRSRLLFLVKCICQNPEPAFFRKLGIDSLTVCTGRFNAAHSVDSKGWFK